MKNMKIVLLLCSVLFIAYNNTSKKETNMQKGTFGYDLEFLRMHHKDLVLLENGDAQLIVLPAYQGRIMTSTAEGNTGESFGWLNHELIASGKFNEHIDA